MNKFLNFIKKHIFKIDVRSNYEIAIDRGMKVGENLSLQPGCTFDVSHSWLIEIGDNVTLAPRVNIIAHDASTKRPLGYILIGQIIIGNNVFVGADTTILPNVVIGDNVIIGAASVVTHNIPSGSVVAGNPARLIKTYDEFIEQRKIQYSSARQFDLSYTLNGKINDLKKQEMKEEVKKGIASIV